MTPEHCVQPKRCPALTISLELSRETRAPCDALSLPRTTRGGGRRHCHRRKCLPPFWPIIMNLLYFSNILSSLCVSIQLLLCSYFYCVHYLHETTKCHEAWRSSRRDSPRLWTKLEICFVLLFFREWKASTNDMRLLGEAPARFVYRSLTFPSTFHKTLSELNVSYDPSGLLTTLVIWFHETLHTTNLITKFHTNYLKILELIIITL